MNDPEHARLHRMLTKHFTVKRVNALRPRIQQLVGCVGGMTGAW